MLEELGAALSRGQTATWGLEDDWNLERGARKERQQEDSQTPGAEPWRREGRAMNISSPTKIVTDSVSNTEFEIYRIWFQMNILSPCLTRYFKKQNSNKIFTTYWLSLTGVPPLFIG